MSQTEEISSQTQLDPLDPDDFKEPFYFRYYSGYKGRAGHEFLEFDVRYNPEDNMGVMRYANNSNYKREELIRKEIGISKLVVSEFKRIIAESEILLESDEQWPDKNEEGNQEISIRYGRHNIKKLSTKRLSSMAEIRMTQDPEGLRVFYYLTHDLKSLVYSLISLHFKIKPV